MTLFQPMLSGYPSHGSALDIRSPNLGGTGGGYNFKDFTMTPVKDQVNRYQASNNLMTPKTNFEAKVSKVSPQ